MQWWKLRHSQAIEAGITKDFLTLKRFISDFGYERAIYLLYGTGAEDAFQMAEKVELRFQAATRLKFGFTTWLEILPYARDKLNYHVLRIRRGGNFPL